ncbi:MAG: chemotaxis protein CheA, partial [Gallionella sp.]
MNDFTGMEELLHDFLSEASEMLSDVDGKLIDLEKFPDDRKLLNDIFRGFHTIKGGAGFLNANELVTLCHLTENLFDKLRTGEMKLNAEIMDVIFAATGEVSKMFGDLSSSRQPSAAPAAILDALKATLAGEKIAAKVPHHATSAVVAIPAEPTTSTDPADQVDWDALYTALTGTDIVEKAGVTRDPEQIAAAVAEEESTTKVFGRRAEDKPGDTVGRRPGDVPAKDAKETTIRVDTVRLDQVLNLSGEIGLTKNRLTHLRADILQGRTDADTLRELDQSVSQLDMLVVNLQNAVMKTRMQPIGRLFNKYPRLARDLARSLGKDVELVLSGEETEMDKTMIEDLNDPLVHLVRNAVDHGVETIEARIAAGKPEKSLVELSARQEGDHILITIADDGRGMRPEVIRSKALEKGIITTEVANTLDEHQCLELIFLPGFSTKDEISSVSGRGVGMDVVKTNIQKLNGTISIHSEPGKGSVFTISLPLTLAILPVLILR